VNGMPDYIKVCGIKHIKLQSMFKQLLRNFSVTPLKNSTKIFIYFRVKQQQSSIDGIAKHITVTISVDI
jgi:hypothetical protein